jgi:MPBQ/MSBQ methyltransferase
LRDEETQLTETELREVYEYLSAKYDGVFDQQTVNNHIRDYVGFTFADHAASLVAEQASNGARLLDIGAGFGSFVLAARRLGLDAVGIEISEFEVMYAKKRLWRDGANEDPESIMYLGDAMRLPFEANTFDIVTLWNVLEHVPDYKRLLSQAHKVLRPGGRMYIICPNYATFRQEAHYLIAWPPLFPRNIAGLYLSLRGKNPGYFRTSIFYTTNWGVIRTLWQLGMSVNTMHAHLQTSQIEVNASELEKVTQPDLIKDPRKRALLTMLHRCRCSWVAGLWLRSRVKLANIYWMNRVRHVLRLYNPLIGSIYLSTRKKR